VTTIQLETERATADFARSIAEWITGGTVLGLRGDLGAGKTTFVRFLVESLGGDVRAVASPTYTLSHEYPVRDSLTVEHWDLYRLNSLPMELEEPTPRTVIRVLEWPDRCPEILSSLTIQLSFRLSVSESSLEHRSVEVSGSAAPDLVARLSKEDPSS
jgi:tRNA threonylcarbamoyladenosine biosynthesis protein TsaE